MANRTGLITTKNILKAFLSPQLQELQKDVAKNVDNVMKSVAQKFLGQLAPKVIEQVEFKQFLENIEECFEDNFSTTENRTGIMHGVKRVAKGCQGGQLSPLGKPIPEDERMEMEIRDNFQTATSISYGPVFPGDTSARAIDRSEKE